MNAKGYSIRGKLTGIIMLTSTAAVLLTCLGFMASGLVNLYRQRVADLSTTAQLVASNSTAALAFEDRKAAQEVLGALRAKAPVVAAAIYDQDREVFARYQPDPYISIPTVILPDGFTDRADRLDLFYAIRLDGERIGTLYIATDARERNARLKEYAIIAAGIALLSLLVAFLLSWWLQGGISRPIVELARVARDVSVHKRFNVRAGYAGLKDGNEIADLMAGFNDMLAEIEQRDHRLLLHQTHLEDTVALRTGELTTANDELRVAKNAAERAAGINAELALESALILNSTTDGIVRVGLDGHATFLNPAAARMLGRSLSEMEGRSIHEVFHHSRADGTPWPAAECPQVLAMTRGAAFASADDRFWLPDGSSLAVEYSSTPMLAEDGSRQGAVLTFRDVTERRAIERLKGEFVSTVSHELRTPLTSIRGALGLLSSGLLGTVGEKGRRMLEIAVSNTDRLVRLINDILDLERIESGRVELQRGTVDASALMLQAMDGVQSMADEAGVRLVALPISAALWGDSDRIIQTLTNLLGNAIKFSAAETTVTLSGILRENDFVFCVADQGRGVPEAKLETIFERFSQVNGSDSRDKGGSGLGLAICKSIVDAHGGRIWAETNDPAGTRFQFTIPLAVSSVVFSELPASGRGAVPSVLLVEDDLDLAKVMTAALQNRGIATIHAVTGREAVQRCRHERPSLIVLDLGLPDMDGFAVVAALRAGKAFAEIPLLVYSALDVGAADQARLCLGRTEFLTKSRSSLADFEGHVVRLLETVPTGRHAA
ncbi:MAG TPA: ATP-binding protein [Thermoanaerobaculia bacterium]